VTLRRVVFDTSTLVSAALRPHSVPFQTQKTISFWLSPSSVKRMRL
jgi:hypothetical protein